MQARTSPYDSPLLSGHSHVRTTGDRINSQKKIIVYFQTNVLSNIYIEAFDLITLVTSQHGFGGITCQY